VIVTGLPMSAVRLENAQFARTPPWRPVSEPLNAFSVSLTAPTAHTTGGDGTLAVTSGSGTTAVTKAEAHLVCRGRAWDARRRQRRIGRTVTALIE
jgi:hypothetical protein